MLQEPVINQDFYTDAVIIVQAGSLEEAYGVIAAENSAWVVDELRALPPKIVEGNQAAIIFAEINGS
jgi:hypothetical protein